MFIYLSMCLDCKPSDEMVKLLAVLVICKITKIDDIRKQLLFIYLFQ